MKYHIITFGCQMNKSDSEKIAAFLEKKGYKPAQKEKEADLIVTNMCSVRQSAVDRINGLAKKLKNLKKEKPKIKTILTGCILKSDKKIFKEKIVEEDKSSSSPFVATRVFDEIWEKEKNIGLNLKPKRKSSYIAYIPISNGCSNFCSYCAVPFMRGPLVCRDHKKIIKEVKQASEQDAGEIWLLGQNVNDYQSPADSKINFAKLIKMVNEITGNFKFFFLSPNPANFSDELIDILAKCEKFGKNLNLPIQSGDNEILKKMNRPYTVSQYKNLVKKIRKKIPDTFLSTDIIVGFPNETKKQFQNTAKLFKQIKFNNAYISKYSPRSETAAFKLKDNIPLKEKKKREQCLRKLL